MCSVYLCGNSVRPLVARYKNSPVADGPSRIESLRASSTAKLNSLAARSRSKHHYDNSEEAVWRFFRTFTHCWHAWSSRKFVKWPSTLAAKRCKKASNWRHICGGFAGSRMWVMWVNLLSLSRSEYGAQTSLFGGYAHFRFAFARIPCFVTL